MKPGIVLKNEGAVAGRACFAAENAVHITLSHNGIDGEALFAADVLLPHRAVGSGRRVCVEEAGGGTRIDYGELSVVHDPDRNTIRYLSGEGGEFLVQRLEEAGGDERVFAIDTHPGEGFYGFGEWFNGFRRENGRLELYNRESPSFAQKKHTYSAFPCFLSDRGYMVFILNAHRARVEINETPGRLAIRFQGGGLDFFVIHGPSWKRILSTYTALTGRPPMVPRWAFGLWNTAYPVENQDQTLARIEEHRKRRIPLDALIFDYHWEEAFHNFRWRGSLFPDPRRMLAAMKARGVRAGLIYTPYINTRGIPLFKILARLYVKNAPDGTPFFAEDSADDLYQEAKRRGFLAHDRVDWWLGRAGALDFTNPDAVDWWFEMHKPLLRQGVSFFKNDGGEYLPEGAVSSKGLAVGEFHNMYGFYYSRALFEKLQEYQHPRRALVFSRTTGIGTQRFPAIFLGDQTPRPAHIAATMRCGLNMSLMGFSYWGADVFGLYRSPSAGMHRLYCQWALFSPVARYFSAPHDPLRNPWGRGRDCEENFRAHAHLRMRLLPHYYRLAFEAWSTGVPIVRPLCLEFQDDPGTRGVADQVMIGESLMLAPVMRKRSRTRRVYFPAGAWYSWWTNERFDGPAWKDVPVRPDRAPLFVRGGFPLVLGPALQHVPDDHRFGELEIHCYPPWQGRTVLYDDDGTTLAYKQGAYSTQAITVKRDRGLIRLTVEKQRGTFQGAPMKKNITLVLHDIDRVRGALMRGARPGNAAKWSYDEQSRSLTVAFPVTMDRPGIIEIE
ncbi:MAG: glycoside hydrolase family 31 protein [Spirochaetes bacterium]|nr:MAG: glycoside hydrolase family 31 protein [Spirochaetota bacterium]